MIKAGNSIRMLQVYLPGLNVHVHLLPLLSVGELGSISRVCTERSKSPVFNQKMPFHKNKTACGNAAAGEILLRKCQNEVL